MTSNRDYKSTKKPSHDQPWHHAPLIGVWEKLHKPEAADQGRTAVPGWELSGQRVQPAASTIAKLCEAFRVSRSNVGASLSNELQRAVQRVRLRIKKMSAGFQNRRKYAANSLGTGLK